MPYIICTDDNRLLTIRESGTYEKRKFALVSYNTDDGSISQTIPLTYEPRISWNSRNCNNNYLAVMDVLGNAYIYQYYRNDSNPKPDPNKLDSFSHLQT